jgi:hypothetical protein
MVSSDILISQSQWGQLIPTVCVLPSIPIGFQCKEWLLYWFPQLPKLESQVSFLPTPFPLFPPNLSSNRARRTSSPITLQAALSPMPMTLVPGRTGLVGTPLQHLSHSSWLDGLPDAWVELFPSYPPVGRHEATNLMV